MRISASRAMKGCRAVCGSMLLLLMSGCGGDTACGQECTNVVKSDSGVATSGEDAGISIDDSEGDAGSPRENRSDDRGSSTGSTNSSSDAPSGNESSSDAPPGRDAGNSDDSSGGATSSASENSGTDAGGDGSGSDASSPADVTLLGTAAVGAPISEGTVIAVCQDGKGFDGTVVTDAFGLWSVDISPSRLPCALQVSFGDPSKTLHSYAAAGVTIANITPLTDLVIAYSSGELPEDWFAAGGGDPRDGVGSLLDAMTSAGFSLPAGEFDPFSTRFSATPEDPHDALLEALAEAIRNDPMLEDYAALLDWIKDGDLAGFPPAPGNENPDAGIEGPDAGNEGPDSDIEDAEDDLSLLISYAGTYSVECSSVEPETRGLATRDHERGSITIGSDGSIDFDSAAGFSFEAEEITQLFDRTTLEGISRRIHVNYDEDDSGRRIDIYLNDALAITEIRYQDGAGGRTRAAIGSDEHCDQGPQDEPELGDDNGASARENGLRKTYTGYAQALSGFDPNTPKFNFNGKTSSVGTAAGWNIQGLLQAGDQSCDDDNVNLSLFVGGTTNPILADTCTINVTTYPEPDSGFNPNATIVGTFSGTFTVDGESVIITEGVFQNQ